MLLAKSKQPPCKLGPVFVDFSIHARRQPASPKVYNKSLGFLQDVGCVQPEKREFLDARRLCFLLILRKWRVQDISECFAPRAGEKTPLRYSACLLISRVSRGSESGREKMFLQ